LKVFCLIRPQPWYRRDAFVSGLRVAGHDVRIGPPRDVDRDTAIVIWNRYADNHEIACRVEAAGGRVLVAENGYLGAGGVSPKFEAYERADPEHVYYAIARQWHNGGGSWDAQDGPDRFRRLGVRVKPWRTEGEHVLVCPNRSFGVPGRMMPLNWIEDVTRRLRRVTSRPIVVRPHPNDRLPQTPLAADLENAWACVIWSSSCGVHSLIEGVPVVSEAPAWICKAAAFDQLPEKLGREHNRARRAALERMAWAQWNVNEIAAGEPFRLLLSDPGKAQGGAYV
jgi:hypothetical protein